MLSARFARWSLLLLTVFLLAAWLPQLKELLFEYRFGKTHLFYSPVAKTFVYKELLGEGHQFIYRDREGNDYSREEFESLIPFIYYKNMELWGKLPLELEGRSFDKAAIRAERQVLQLKPEELPGHAPRIQLFPLLESNPGRARLRFPENVFRPGDQLEFIDSDHNSPNPRHASHDGDGDHVHPTPELTATFTEALAKAGFRFPVEATFGRVSILKPFDAGYFLLDADGGLFHLIRVNAQPRVQAVPLPDGLAVRHVKVTENKRKETLGLLLDQEDQLYIIGYEDNRLTPLDLPDYVPDRMELKIIFNPLYRTAIYSDRETIHAVVMDRDYQPLERYSRTMAMAAPRLPDRIWNALVPFSLSLHEPDSRYLSLRPRLHSWSAAAGSALALLLAALYLKWRGHRPGANIPDLALVLLTGLYGLLALILLPPDGERV